jgi:hypothetical protein
MCWSPTAVFSTGVRPQVAVLGDRTPGAGVIQPREEMLRTQQDSGTTRAPKAGCTQNRTVAGLPHREVNFAGRRVSRTRAAIPSELPATR